ncbi:hypothetical protein GF402_11445 [Candidatus Fermentibacteria bacterium]|nr:hypothetical protein [Candidatus Fermentibacteria bacterium]
MNPLLILAMLLIAQGRTDREMPRIYVHEWGVMTYGECRLELAATPPTFSPSAVRAPVVYFHGPEFTGTFSVRVPGGYLTDTYPVPDSGGSGLAVWTGLRGSYDLRDEHTRRAIRDVPGEFEEYLASWRQSGSLLLSRGNDFLDKFLYYECVLEDSLLSPDRWIVPVQYVDGELLLKPLVPGVSEDGEVLVLMRDGEGCRYLRCPQSRLERRIVPDDLLPYDTEDVVRVLLDWNHEDLDLEEIVALWKTWEDFLTGTVGSRDMPPPRFAVIARMDPEKLDELCSLELTPERDYTVEYHRFILSVLLLDELSAARRTTPDEFDDLR